MDYSSGAPWSPAAWESAYGAQHFSVLVYDTTGPDQPAAACSALAGQNVGYGYFTPSQRLDQRATGAVSRQRGGRLLTGAARGNRDGLAGGTVPGIILAHMSDYVIPEPEPKEIDEKLSMELRHLASNAVLKGKPVRQREVRELPVLPRALQRHLLLLAPEAAHPGRSRVVVPMVGRHPRGHLADRPARVGPASVKALLVGEVAGHRSPPVGQGLDEAADLGVLAGVPRLGDGLVVRARGAG